jgi:hypothetical protein
MIPPEALQATMNSPGIISGSMYSHSFRPLTAGVLISGASSPRLNPRPSLFVTMIRVLFAAFLALTFSAVTFAVPREVFKAGVARATPSWKFTNCGAWVFVGLDTVDITERCRHTGTTNNVAIINSVNISPDQPKAGQSLTLSVDFDVTTTIVVGKAAPVV